jgi:hypothetical protein
MQKCELDSTGSDGAIVGSCKYGIKKKPLVVMICSEFLEQLHGCGLIKNYVEWS